jgi:hypothetical protein
VKHDRPIRESLKRWLSLSDASAVTIDELSIGSFGRADVLAVNGSIRGFEIKSQNDHLTRLERQVTAYERICDECSVVSGSSHIKSLLKRLPSHWGISVVDDGFGILSVRDPLPNPNISLQAIVRLLWNVDKKAFLKRLGIKFPSRAGCFQLNEIVIANVDRAEIAAEARRRICGREAERQRTLAMWREQQRCQEAKA